MELIDKMGVIRALVEHKENIKDFGELKAYIDRLHTEESRPKGKWIKVTNARGGHECTLCHNYAPSWRSGDENLSAYCPFCGADMRGEE